MELVDMTPLASELVVGLDDEHPGAKHGCISAKATFRVGADGGIDLDSDDPVELLAEDVETPLGILPNDLPVRRGRDFEVMMLAAAYAPGGRPASESMVTLSVGDRSRALRVVGDRRWVDGAEGPALTPPEPFVRMPLTWERAFGGTAQVWLDERSTTQVSHSLNARGRGFDPSRDIEGLAREVHVAEGFPRTDYVRLAPNLEAAGWPIQTPEDSPVPVCFSPPPVDLAIGSRRVAEVLQIEEQDRPPLTEVAGLRAAADWVFESAPLGQPVHVSGCRPDGDFSFAIPTSVPVMDYVLGDRTASRDLTPQLLMLLPEERRFYILYRHYFLMRAEEGEERSIRLRFG